MPYHEALLPEGYCNEVVRKLQQQIDLMNGQIIDQTNLQEGVKKAVTDTITEYAAANQRQMMANAADPLSTACKAAIDALFAAIPKDPAQATSIGNTLVGDLGTTDRPSKAIFGLPPVGPV